MTIATAERPLLHHRLVMVRRARHDLEAVCLASGDASDVNGAESFVDGGAARV
jgi:hypothetical protein